MRRFKKALSVSVAAAMAVSMMACGSTPSDTTTAAPQGGDKTTEAATTKSGGEAETTKSAASGDKIKMRVSWWGSQTRTDRTCLLYTSYKGNIIKEGTTAPYSLYNESIASFTTGDLYDHHDAEGFINLFGLSLKVRAMKKAEVEK